MDIDEVVREFTAYRESGWSNSEVPSCASLFNTLTALEKQIPMKAVKKEYDWTDSFRCGRCEEFVRDYKYCPACGQRREGEKK